MGVIEGLCCLLHAFMIILNYFLFFQYCAMHCTIQVPDEKVRVTFPE